MFNNKQYFEGNGTTALSKPLKMALAFPIAPSKFGPGIRHFLRLTWLGLICNWERKAKICGHKVVTNIFDAGNLTIYHLVPPRPLSPCIRGTALSLHAQIMSPPPLICFRWSSLMKPLLTTLTPPSDRPGNIVLHYPTPIQDLISPFTLFSRCIPLS
jgi:hypothetical protein